MYFSQTIANSLSLFPFLPLTPSACFSLLHRSPGMIRNALNQMTTNRCLRVLWSEQGQPGAENTGTVQQLRALHFLPSASFWSMNLEVVTWLTEESVRIRSTQCEVCALLHKLLMQRRRRAVLQWFKQTAPQLSCWIPGLYHKSDTFYRITIHKHLFLYQKTLKKINFNSQRLLYKHEFP